MQSLLMTEKKTKSKIQQLVEKGKTAKSEIVKKVNPILSVMNKAEEDVLKEMKEKLNVCGIYQLYPIPYRIDRIYSMSQSKETLNLKEDRYDCDGFYTKSYRIPFAYFDLKKDEIYDAHAEWCRNHLEERCMKNASKQINNKKGMILRLQKEIKKLKDEIKILQK